MPTIPKEHVTNLFHHSAPLLLIIIAFAQIVRSQTQDLTPWKGGGFGMFASWDSRGMREPIAFLIMDSGEHKRVQIPNEFKHQVSDIRSLPTDDRLEELARRLAQMDWHRLDRVETEAAPLSDLTTSGDGLSLYFHDELPNNMWNSLVDLRYSESQFVAKSQATAHLPEVSGVKGVRLELWRGSFVSSGPEIVFERTTIVEAIDREHGEFDISLRVESDT